MPKTREQKKQILNDLIDKFGRAKSVIFADFKGLKAKESEELRKQLKSEGGEYYVAKKTLVDLAVKEAKMENVSAKNLEGQLAAVFGYEDEVAPAKVIDKFAKDKENRIKFLGGILENKFLTGSEIKNLAKIPSKPELYAKIVGSLNAPVSGFVNVLAGNLRGLVNVLKAIGEKK